MRNNETSFVLAMQKGSTSSGKAWWYGGGKMTLNLLLKDLQSCILNASSTSRMRREKRRASGKNPTGTAIVSGNARLSGWRGAILAGDC
jgi:hypothetical protein